MLKITESSIKTFTIELLEKHGDQYILPFPNPEHRYV
jgi:hypothetical protein